MARVEWHADALIQSVDLAVAHATKKGAGYIAGKMRANATHDKEMQAAIRVMKSRHENGGHIAGVFSSKIPASGKWEDSLAARAIYQDYGHALPYQGRGHMKKTQEIIFDKWGNFQTRSKRRSKIAKSVPGNHFIRKSLRAGKRAVLKFFEGALKG